VSQTHAGALARLVPLCIGLGLLAPARAGACSVCLPGDPRFSSFGANAEPAGSVSLYLEARRFEKSSGALPHGHEEGEEEHEHDGDEESRGERLDLHLSWAPTDRLTLTLGLPFASNRIIEHEEDARTHSTLAGVGDVSLASTLVLWRDRSVLPSRWLEGRLWLKAPTGRDETKVDGGRDPHLQPGTGSWDWGVGLAGVQRLSRGSLYASLFYRENQEGSLGYEFGDAFLANLGFETPLGHWLGRPEWDGVTPGLELNFRYAGYDHADGVRYDDSGGAILYATPTLRIRLPFGVGDRKASLRAAVELPLGQTWLHQRQHEEEIWSLGLLLPF
jgi:hypothetical protein